MDDRRQTSPRSQVLSRLGVLQAVPAPELHRTARLAAHLARQAGGEPLAAVHLLDDAFQHRVASAGHVPLVRTPVEDSMCIQVVREGRSVYSSDATTADRFDGNPFTTGPDPVRLYYSTPLRTSDGTPVGTLCVFSLEPGVLDAAQRARLDDLAEQTSAHLELAGMSRDLAHLATHDPLTEVANRLLLSHQLEAALADPDRAGQQPALLLLDLDDFKDVNDRYGHQVGDEVLRSTAQRLLGCVRDTDLVARLGGDEFAVLVDALPHAGLLDELAERVREAGRAPHDTSAGPLRCAFSVGQAIAQEHDLAYELVGRADADMYARKTARELPLPR
jgi:diguanylate cyclase (GGDEF)-like protein